MKLIEFDVPFKQYKIRHLENFLKNNGLESLLHDLKGQNRYPTKDKSDRELYEKHRYDLLGDITSFLNEKGGYSLSFHN